MLGLAGCLASVKPHHKVVLLDKASHVTAFEAPSPGSPVFSLLQLASRVALPTNLRQVLLLKQL